MRPSSDAAYTQEKWEVFSALSRLYHPTNVADLPLKLANRMRFSGDVKLGSGSV